MSTRNRRRWFVVDVLIFLRVPTVPRGASYPGLSDPAEIGLYRSIRAQGRAWAIPQAEPPLKICAIDVVVR